MSVFGYIVVGCLISIAAVAGAAVGYFVIGKEDRERLRDGTMN